MNKHHHYNNITLIGMPGCGKSTVGVLLAKRLGYGFIDTDILIQISNRKTLAEIIAEQGYLTLRQLEEKVLLSLASVQQVFATGGSAVYSLAGIANLKQLGPLIYLRTSLPVLQQRVGDTVQRGVASAPGMSFEDIYAERCPLYEQAADKIIDCDDLNPDQVVDKIVAAIEG